MATRMKAARRHAPKLANERKARRRNAKKRPLRADTVHSDMPLWGRPGYLLRRLHQIHYALFFEECAGFDITPVQYGLLTTLSVNPDLSIKTHWPANSESTAPMSPMSSTASRDAGSSTAAAAGTTDAWSLRD